MAEDSLGPTAKDPVTQEGLECAICFCEISDAEKISLPCQCRVPYCLSCWDRSLAAAFNDSGAARCPTCRTQVQVDFDPEARNGCGSLVFSVATEGNIESRSAVVNRLAEQAAPLMARKMRQFGEEHSCLRATIRDPAGELRKLPISTLRAMLSQVGSSASDLVEKEEMVTQLVDSQIGNGMSMLAWLACTADDATSAGSGSTSGIGGESSAGRLHCVCGGRLARLSGRERYRQLFSSQEPQLTSEHVEFLLDHLLQMPEPVSCVVCDLCDRQLSPSSPVFSCGNGERTIVHPTTYDVCENCFVHFCAERRGDEILAITRAA